jgi:hypothetical protein
MINKGVNMWFQLLKLLPMKVWQYRRSIYVVLQLAWELIKYVRSKMVRKPTVKAENSDAGKPLDPSQSKTTSQKAAP